jgi:hypothetical protein
MELRRELEVTAAASSRPSSGEQMSDRAKLADPAF